MNERSRLPWTEEEVAKLRSLTGNHSTAEIAQELGRGVAATITKAADLHISLRKKRTLGLKTQISCPEPGPRPAWTFPKLRAHRRCRRTGPRKDECRLPGRSGLPEPAS